MMFPPKLIAIRILAKNEQKQDVVKKLQELGVLHITQTDLTSPILENDTSLPKADKVSELLLNLEYLAKQANITREKGMRSLPELDQGITEAQDFVDKHLPRMKRLVEEKQELTKQKEHNLAHIESVKKLPFTIDVPKAKNTVTLLFQSNRAVRIQTTRAKIVYRRDGKKHFYRIHVPRSRAEELEKKLLKTTPLKKIDISFLSQNSDSFAKHAMQRAHEAEKKLRDAEKRIRTVLEGKEQLLQYLLAALKNLHGQQTVTNNFKTTKYLFVAKGYCEKKDLEKIKQALPEVSITADPADNKSPTKLAHKGLNKHFGHITELFSIPKYGALDPTTLVSFFYPFFFGFMLSDIGYGLLLIAAVLMLKDHFTGAMKSAIPVFVLSGVSAVIFGFVFGSFFGNLIKITPLYADAFSSAFPLLIISLVIGLAHMNLGIILQLIQYIKQKKSAKRMIHDIAPFPLLELVVALLVLKLIVPAIIAGIILIIIVIQAKGIFGIMDITGYFGTWFSYARLLALSLATAGVALAINIIAQKAAALGAAGVVLAGIIILAGHLFNFIVNLIGCSINAARLHYVEFFGLFFDGGGQKFSPFKIQSHDWR